MNEKIKQKMVDRFLGWKLPESFCPDCYIAFNKELASEPNCWPTGTNLFTATEARQMIEYLLDGQFALEASESRQVGAVSELPRDAVVRLAGELHIPVGITGGNISMYQLLAFSSRVYQLGKEQAAPPVPVAPVLVDRQELIKDVKKFQLSLFDNRSHTLMNQVIAAISDKAAVGESVDSRKCEYCGGIDRQRKNGVLIRCCYAAYAMD